MVSLKKAVWLNSGLDSHFPELVTRVYQVRVLIGGTLKYFEVWVNGNIVKVCQISIYYWVYT